MLAAHFPHISAFADDEKMTREIRTTPRDINSLLLNEAGSLPAAFPGVFAIVAVGASTALFTTGFVVVFAS